MIELSTSIAAFGPFAKKGTYLPPGAGAEEVEVRVILDLDIEIFDGRAVSHVDAGDFLIKEIVPEKGGVLSQVKGFDWMEWEILSRQEDDGFVVTMHMDRSEQ